MHSPFVEMIRTVVRRGVDSGDFQVAVDPVQLYISIAGLCFFYLSNSATLSVIFGRDCCQGRQGRAACAHGRPRAGRADGPSTALFEIAKAPKSRSAVAQTVAA